MKPSLGNRAFVGGRECEVVVDLDAKDEGLQRWLGESRAQFGDREGNILPERRGKSEWTNLARRFLKVKDGAGRESRLQEEIRFAGDEQQVIDNEDLKI